MGHAPDWLRNSMAKKPSDKISPSNRDDGNPFHGPKAVKNTFNSEGKVHKTLLHRAEGGPVGGADVGFWERFKAGNIDEPGTEAYNRWGQGARNRIQTDEEERAATAAHWRDYTPLRDREKAEQADVRKTEPVEPASKKAVASSGTESYEDDTPSGRVSMGDNDENYVQPKPKREPKAKAKAKPKEEPKRKAEPADVRRVDVNEPVTGVDYAGVSGKPAAVTRSGHMTRGGQQYKGPFSDLFERIGKGNRQRDEWLANRKGK